ncbi:DnaJ C-terminal domain-containing protein [Sandarakinorhabdus rubra]|uniref:DnaJ C-terminal domain-containing protein n=1 Tax=Sandarakinorhabdus rubra TaxID=2672568 RepID=UPI0013DBAFD2|nr:DnaJ C-terminal domain-containing protein [Sandarakinorhabdus rubra]
MRDPYTVLGITRSADEAEIKKAFRRLAKDNHPDRNANDPKAMERFKEANAAYELLSDPAKRGQYDRGEIGPDGQPLNPFAGGGYGGGFNPRDYGGGRAGGGGFDFAQGADDLFAELFGGRSPFGGTGGSGGRGFRTQVRGPDVAYRLTVPFEDAVALKPQRVVLKSGQAIEIKLPAGLESGKQVRLAGKGEPGPGGPGDAIVTIEIAPHRVLVRDGDDVRLTLPIRLDEAVLGAKVMMPTAEGRVALTIPPGTASGRMFRLKGRGFRRLDGTRGDQLVTVQIDIPADHAGLKAFAETFVDDRDIRSALDV